jgi:membrane protease YdiL (CAAX protease family)
MMESDMGADGAPESGTRQTDYYAESRSFALGLLSVLPIVVLYHLGIVRSGHGARNMAEVWLEGPLSLVGLEAAHLLNVALLVAFIAVLVRGRDAGPPNLLLILGIIGEGAAYAALLYKAAPMVAGLVDDRASTVFFSIEMFLPGRTHDYLLALGAGVYEELVFRLLLLGGGTALLSKVFMWERRWSVGVMLAISSLLFAAAHHIGPYRDPVESYSLIYRTVCGALLGAIFLTRGFGIAVWTHAIYNALVMAQQVAAEG